MRYHILYMPGSNPNLKPAEAPLEHFELIEDVVAHIRSKLPAESGENSWKMVCEDVLQCHLPQVEPLLLQELAQADGNLEEEQKLRGLLRAVSWYQHPPRTTEELVTTLNHLRPTHPDPADQTRLQTIQAALQERKMGSEALSAADDVEALFKTARGEDERAKLREVRDQIYYQLLYPHWFDVMKQWANKQSNV